MILRSFPRLRRRRISIVRGGEDDLLSYTVEGDHHLVAVNECLLPAPDRALIGGLAHELVHIDTDLRMGWFLRELAWNRYLSSHWCRMREERATELRVIELGYGRNLLAFVRYAHRLGRTFSREHGLLYAEIGRAVRKGTE